MRAVIVRPGAERSRVGRALRSGRRCQANYCSDSPSELPLSRAHFHHRLTTDDERRRSRHQRGAS